MKKLTLEKAKRGTVIVDDKTGEQFLIIEVRDKVLDCLAQDLNRVSLGTDWINSYSIYDTYDMDKFSHFITNSLKRAKWEINCDGYYPYCTNCMNEPPGREMTEFCPRCGAYMRGDKNDKP